MSDVEFLVERIFDIEGRIGLLVAGRVMNGCISAGSVLEEERSGALVRVITLELGPIFEDLARVTLLVDRRDRNNFSEGSTLIAGRGSS